MRCWQSNRLDRYVLPFTQVKKRLKQAHWIFVRFPESLVEHSLTTSHKNVSVPTCECLMTSLRACFHCVVYLYLWSSH